MTLHGDAVRVLTAWAPSDAGQARLQAQYLEHLATHADAMWRECRPDHLTASALVVSADGRDVLLTLHRRIGRWLQMGGHCEPADGSLAGSALREATEESGIAGLALRAVPARLSYHEVPCGPVRPAHHLDVQYVAAAPADAVPVISDESADLRWFPLDELPSDADGALRALVATAAAGSARLP
ncbi:MAG: NUDIX domain-containing protein [Propionibacteriales bacterium]|nr:NUDIX domain-containing protein [Propionibacteriales bacterium]